MLKVLRQFVDVINDEFLGAEFCDFVQRAAAHAARVAVSTFVEREQQTYLVSRRAQLAHFLESTSDIEVIVAARFCPMLPGFSAGKRIMFEGRRLPLGVTESAG